MTTNDSILQAEARRIAHIAAAAHAAMDTFQQGKVLSEADMAALHDTMGLFIEVESGIEAVDAFNRRTKLAHFWNLSDIHALNAAVWYFTVRKHTAYRPEAVHEVLRETRAWCVLLRRMEHAESLEGHEVHEFGELWRFLKECELLAERVARGEPLPPLPVEPAQGEIALAR